MPYVVRFKMPVGEEVKAKDLIRGEVKFNTSILDDKVIFKSDGLPTYHLANVADDYAMKISHVIRGEEWLPSLPLHVMLYKALDWEKEMPQFAHLPLILKPSGEISAGYRESGYFADAVVNLLALLGWNPGTEQELFSLEELIQSFALERVNKSGARFDPEKAKWFNQQYLQKKSNSELAEIFQSVLTKKGVSVDKSFTEKVVGMVKERAVFPIDIWEQASYFFEAPKEYNPKNQKKFWKEDTPEIVKDCLEILKGIEPFSSVRAEEEIKAYIEKNELGFGKIMNPLRLAIVGAGKGPHLFDIMEMIGKDETLRRIETALEKL